MNKKKRVHPYTSVIYLKKFLFFIIVPAVQTLIFRKINNVYSILNLIFCLVVVLYAVIRAYFESCSIYGDTISITRGLIVRTNIQLPISSVDSITIHKGLISGKLFGVRRFFADVPSLSRKMNTAVYVSHGRAKEIVECLAKKDNKKKIYTAKKYKTLFMAVLWSNSLTGFLILMPFMNNINKLFGGNPINEIYEDISITKYLIYIGFPPVAATVTNILLICWVFSVVLHLGRYLIFNVEKNESLIYINRGFFSRATFITGKESVNAVTIKQNISMIPFNIYSAYIHTISTEKTKGDKSLLISPERRKNTMSIIGEIMNYDAFSGKGKVRPPRSARAAYIYFPFCIMSADALLAMTLIYFGTDIKLIFIISIFTMPVILIWIVFRLMAFGRASFSYGDEGITLTNYNGFSFNENLIPLKKLQKLDITQSIFQKINGRCNIIVYVYSENNMKLKIKQISLDSAKNICNNLYQIR
ncbi:MAG: PH domain-containing protein [Clostridia bacterium]|nr:PH domain-containing protein [Clostridia bacterium]